MRGEEGLGRIHVKPEDLEAFGVWHRINPAGTFEIQRLLARLAVRVVAHAENVAPGAQRGQWVIAANPPR